MDENVKLKKWHVKLHIRYDLHYVQSSQKFRRKYAKMLKNVNQVTME